MPKYLMFDHGGVLDNGTTLNVSPEDIVLSDLGDGVANVLAKGTDVVRIINRLVNEFDYQVVYHSSNVAADQLYIHNQLVNGSRAKGLTFPRVALSAAPNPSLTIETPTHPQRTTLGSTGIPFLSYAPVTTSTGKSCVRSALASALGIGTSRDARQQHVVFDDGPSNITQARAEGYSAYLINEHLTLADALEQVLQRELALKAAAMTSPAITPPGGSAVPHSSTTTISSAAIAFDALHADLKSTLSLITKTTRQNLVGNPPTSTYWNSLPSIAQGELLNRAQEQLLKEQHSTSALIAPAKSQALFASTPVPLGYESFDTNLKAALSVITKGTRSSQSGNPATSVYWNALPLAEKQNWLEIANIQIAEEQRGFGFPH